MDDVLFYAPGAFWLQQECTCKNSRVLNDVHFDVVSVEGDTVTMQAASEPPKCSVCGLPYKMKVDTSKCVLIKNAAED